MANYSVGNRSYRAELMFRSDESEYDIVEELALYRQDGLPKAVITCRNSLVPGPARPASIYVLTMNFDPGAQVDEDKARVAVMSLIDQLFYRLDIRGGIEYVIYPVWAGSVAE